MRIETVGNDTHIHLEQNEHFPEDMTFFPGDLYVDAPSDFELPANLRVGGSLLLMCSLMTKLPRGLRVDGNLNLDGCPFITTLPSGLWVGGFLNLDNSSVVTIEKSIVVSGLVSWRNAAISESEKKKQKRNILSI